MDKYYSYTDFLKAVGQYPRLSESDQILNEIYLDLFLNGLLRQQRISQLESLIDMSLDVKDEQAFKLYSSELLKLKEEELSTV